MKDEALNPAGERMVLLPIARPNDETRTAAENGVKRLLTLTEMRRRKIAELIHWLQVEFALDKAGDKLETLSGLDQAGFIEEVRKRRPKVAGRLSAAALRDLSDTGLRYLTEVTAFDAEMLTHEHRLSDLVNAAYGLTPADIDLMWRTAPPRMPFKLLQP